MPLPFPFLFSSDFLSNRPANAKYFSKNRKRKLIYRSYHAIRKYRLKLEVLLFLFDTFLLGKKVMHNQ